MGDDDDCVCALPQIFTLVNLQSVDDSRWSGLVLCLYSLSCGSSGPHISCLFLVQLTVCMHCSKSVFFGSLLPSSVCVLKNIFSFSQSVKALCIQHKMYKTISCWCGLDIILYLCVCLHVFLIYIHKYTHACTFYLGRGMCY